MRIRVAATLGALALAAAVVSAGRDQARASAPPSPFLVDLKPSPPNAAAGSAEPNLTVDARGRVWLSWLEPADAGRMKFQLASLDVAAGTWGPTITVASGDKLLANWADFPSIFAASNGTLAAHWLERGAARGSYGIRVAISSNGGRTWTSAVTPHRDDSASEHGFVSFFESPATGLGLVWLDGREMAGGHATTGHAGAMTLRSTSIAKDGTAGTETVIDTRVCDCCQTAAARTADGVLVAYRDRSDKEIRDIVVSRFEKGAWTPPTVVGADNWEINGCPVNGPAVAATGNAAAVAWFTAVGNTPRTQIAFSGDGGRTFGAPMRVDAAPTLGRVGLVMIGENRALVSSIERAQTGAQLVVRDIRRDGPAGAAVTIAPMSPDRTSGFPRVVVAGRTAIFAWTEVAPGKPTQVRVIRALIR
ncbi:MAG TPA: hypothetical protein VFV98_00300 [Vicinamibacterales bacterium]|nr:hypothetical protein [Vicinamibacterales bacterium]